MKLLVVSDSHGHGRDLQRVLEMHTDAAALLFLGDGLRDLPLDAAIPIRAVRGNCDSFTLFDDDPPPTERTEVFGARRITMLHGHTRSAKMSNLRLIGLGAEQDADVVCFGHTHEPVERCIPAETELFGVRLARPLYLFNPGALRDGSFGLITLAPSGVLLSHGRL